MKLIKFEESIGGGQVYVNMDKVSFIESDDEKAIITFDNGRRIPVTETSESIMKAFGNGVWNANLHNKE